MKKMSKIISVVIYGIGTIITLALLILFLLHSDIVLFPDAMLPMQLYELASGWLAFGFFPMFAASVWVYHTFHIFESMKKRRNTFLVFLPSVICGCFLVFWVSGDWDCKYAQIMLA